MKGFPLLIQIVLNVRMGAIGLLLGSVAQCSDAIVSMVEERRLVHLGQLLRIDLIGKHEGGTSVDNLSDTSKSPTKQE